MDSNPQNIVNQPTSTVPPLSSSKHLNLLTAFTIGLLMLLLGLGWGYLLFANKNEIKQVSMQALPTVNPTSISPTVSLTPKKADDNTLVIAASKAVCESQVDLQGNLRIFKLGKTGPNQKDVMYSTDKQFARLNAVCESNAEVGQGSGKLHILKKINEQWIQVWEGQQENPAATQTYQIPSLFN